MANPTTAQVQAIIDAGQYVYIAGELYGPPSVGKRTAPSQAAIDAYYAAMAAAQLHTPLQGH